MELVNKYGTPIILSCLCLILILTLIIFMTVRNL